jgi:hypothetical protein
MGGSNKWRLERFNFENDKNMIKNIFLFVFLTVLGANSSFGQSIKCRLLTVLLQNKEARKAFLLDMYPNMPIVFIDVKNFFPGCVMANYRERKVELVHDSSRLNKKDISNLEIKDFQAHSGRFRLVVNQQDSNAAVAAEFEENGNEIVVSKVTVGHF